MSKPIRPQYLLALALMTLPFLAMPHNPRESNLTGESNQTYCRDFGIKTFKIGSNPSSKGTCQTLVSNERKIVPDRLSPDSEYKIGIYSGGRVIAIRVQIQDQNGKTLYSARKNNQFVDEIFFSWNGYTGFGSDRKWDRDTSGDVPLDKGDYYIVVRASLEQFNRPPRLFHAKKKFSHDPNWLQKSDVASVPSF